MVFYESNYRFINDQMNNYFLSANGERIDLYKYSSALEEKLSTKLKDPDYAKLIVDSYQKHILPVLRRRPDSENLEALWDKYLLSYCQLLGINADKSYGLFLNKPSSKEFKEFIRSHSLHCYSFFMEIKKHEEELQSNYQKNSRTVVILSSSSGGGHVVTAHAIKEFMERNSYKVTILDPDELVRNKDPLILGGFTYKKLPITMGEVYSHIFQQDDNLELAKKIWKKGEKIRKYQPEATMKEAIKRIRELKPSLLFSVATQHSEHTSIANRTGTPLKFVHTDYGFNNALLPLVDKVSGKLIKFWVNAEDPEILHLDQGVLQGLKMNIHDHEPPESYENMLKNLKEKDVVQVCGFPIRSSFKRETSAENIRKIKAEMGVPHDHHVVLIAMGKFGIASHLSKYMKLFTDPNNEYNKPIELVIICGKNLELKSFLEEENKNSRSNAHKHVNVRLEGFLEEEKMARYYKIADLLISKPGGATSAEVSEMALPFLAPHAHAWEWPNLSHLERHGLGEVLLPHVRFSDQINKLLIKKRTDIDKPIDWQQRFMALAHLSDSITPIRPVSRECLFDRKIVTYHSGKTSLSIPMIKETSGTLGWGHQGVVKVYRHDHSIAIKKTLGSFAQDVFLNEFELGSILNHPQILSTGNLYKKVNPEGKVSKLKLVMERVFGTTLYELAKDPEKKDKDLISKWINQAKDCCLYLFDMKIVWDDLYGGNLFITSQGNLKLIDLGRWRKEENIEKRAEGLLRASQDLVFQLLELGSLKMVDPDNYDVISKLKYKNPLEIKRMISDYFDSINGDLITDR